MSKSGVKSLVEVPGPQSAAILLTGTEGTADSLDNATMPPLARSTSVPNLRVVDGARAAELSTHTNNPLALESERITRPSSFVADGTELHLKPVSPNSMSREMADLMGAKPEDISLIAGSSTRPIMAETNAQGDLNIVLESFDFHDGDEKGWIVVLPIPTGISVKEENGVSKVTILTQEGSPITTAAESQLRVQYGGSIEGKAGTTEIVKTYLKAGATITSAALSNLHTEVEVLGEKVSNKDADSKTKDRILRCKDVLDDMWRSLREFKDKFEIFMKSSHSGMDKRAAERHADYRAALEQIQLQQAQFVVNIEKLREDLRKVEDKHSANESARKTLQMWVLAGLSTIATTVSTYSFFYVNGVMTTPGYLFIGVQLLTYAAIGLRKKF